MEKNKPRYQREGLMDMMKRKRMDPSGDLSLDPDEEPREEDAQEEYRQR